MAHEEEFIIAVLLFRDDIEIVSIRSGHMKMERHVDSLLHLIVNE